MFWLLSHGQRVCFSILKISFTSLSMSSKTFFLISVCNIFSHHFFDISFIFLSVIFPCIYFFDPHPPKKNKQRKEISVCNISSHQIFLWSPPSLLQLHTQLLSHWKATHPGLILNLGNLWSKKIHDSLSNAGRDVRPGVQRRPWVLGDWRGLLGVLLPGCLSHD